MKAWWRRYWWGIATAGWLALVVLTAWPQIGERFELDYLENLYSTSQWMIPLSRRIMADEQLYVLAGYRVWQGASIYSINPETPPLGKLLYGAWLGREPRVRLLALGSVALALVGFAWLARRWTRLAVDEPNARPAVAGRAVLLLALTPLFFSQASVAMLDIFQLLALIGHGLALTYYQPGRRRRWLAILAAGGFLGIFAGIKVPFFVPAIVAADAVLIYWCQRGTRQAKLWASAAEIAVLGGGGPGRVDHHLCDLFSPGRQLA